MELGDTMMEEPFDWDGYFDDQERDYTIAMLTCPYYWNERIEGATCRNGCVEEPACHTGGPFEFPPDWPPERCLSRAVDRHVHEHPPA